MHFCGGSQRKRFLFFPKERVASMQRLGNVVWKDPAPLGKSAASQIRCAVGGVSSHSRLPILTPSPLTPLTYPHLNPNLKPSCRVELVKQGKVRQSVVFLGPSHYKGLCHLFLNLSIQPCLKPYQNRSPTQNLSTSSIELTRVGDMGI